MKLHFYLEPGVAQKLLDLMCKTTKEIYAMDSFFRLTESFIEVGSGSTLARYYYNSVLEDDADKDNKFDMVVSRELLVLLSKKTKGLSISYEFENDKHKIICTTGNSTSIFEDMKPKHPWPGQTAEYFINKSNCSITVNALNLKQVASVFAKLNGDAVLTLCNNGVLRVTTTDNHRLSIILSVIHHDVPFKQIGTEEL